MCRRYLLIIFLLVLCPFGRSLFGQDGIATELEEELHKAMSENNYQLAWEYVNLLEQQDTISLMAMLDCADCFIGLEKYQECLVFCDKWEDRNPLFRERETFADKYGECYYYLGQYSLASYHLGHYISWMEEEKYQVGMYHYSIYSKSLYRTGSYSRACKYFKKFFSEAASVEKTSVDKLFLTGNKDYYGYAFYDYAYSCFFLGEESMGATLLENAFQCGNVDASKDLSILRKCKTFASDVEIGKKYYDAFEEYIKRFDFREVARNLKKDNPATFWNTLLYYNDDFQTLSKARNKENPSQTLVKAEKEINNSKSNVESALLLCSPYRKGEFETELEGKLFGRSSFVNDLRVYPSDDINAFATPYGQIYLTEALVDRFHFNNNLLLGVCAHESVHFLCEHSLASLWQSAEKERKSAVAGALAAGLSAVAMASTGIYAASNGVEFDDDYWDNSSRLSSLIMDSFAENAYLFRFKYSRSQEIESDIIAYRFCDYLGIGGYSYIMALQLLGDDSFYLHSDPESDHPTTMYRVMLLKYLFQRDKEQDAIDKQNEDIEWLYQKLNAAGYKLGTVTAFRNSLKKDANVKKYYEASIKEGLNVGTYEQFYHFIKVK